jgi:hypothetical protein
VKLLVVGGGVAGAAAAQRAAALGLMVTWVRGSSSASALSSGACDWAAWEEAPEQEVLTPELLAFVEALGAWVLPPRPARVVSARGLLRRALAHDPLVLNLEPLAGSNIAYVRAGRDAALDMAPALAKSAWALRSATHFFSVAVDNAATAAARLGLLLQLAAARRVGAWLLPSDWLTTSAERDALVTALGVAVGTPLSEAGGGAGQRLQARLDGFLPNGVERVTGWVNEVMAEDGAITASLRHGRDGGSAASEPLRVDGCVLALGGVLGGGIVLNEHGQFAPSLHLADARFELRADPTVRALDVSAPGGIDFCQLGVSALSQVGFRAGSAGRLAPRLYAAGECLPGAPRTILAAAASAIAAVDALHLEMR